MANQEAATSMGDADNPFNLADLWAKAYKNVHENEEYSELLDKFETHLQQANDMTTSSASGGLRRLEDIQRLARKNLEVVEQARTSFSLRGKKIVIREVVQNTIRTVSQFKAIISGAVSSEPHAALAWACVLGVLPILESVFKQDEDAAEGFNKIVFTMVRYQHLLQTVVLRDFTKSSQDENTGQLFLNIETQLVSFYEQVYLYQIQFVRQYGKSKWRRHTGNIFDPKDWKQMWSTIDTTRDRIDTSIRDRVSVRILDTWEAMSSIEKGTENVLKTVEEIQDTQKATLEWELLKSLQIASNALFDSSEVQGAQNYCLKGTQKTLLDEIRDWADSPAGESIFWLHGMAGTGKSSIALTAANALKEGEPFTKYTPSPANAILDSSFFFKQGDATRNSIRDFFPTLAWDLAGISPSIKTLIARAIEKNPSITTKAPQQQLEHLIVNPLSVLDERSFISIHLIVVVDALDECIDPREAEELVSMLSPHLKSLHRVQLRFLITSRSERHLVRTFEQLPVDLCHSVVLEKIEQCVTDDGRRDDITFYFDKTLATVAKRHNVYPGVINEAIINSLSKKSDGLFIYAATACRFLDAEDFDDDEARQERLELILENGTENDDTATDDSKVDEWEADSPQNHVDEIYCKVLSFPDREKMSPAMRKKTYKDMRTVFGFLVVFFEPVSISSLKVFLSQLSEKLDKLLSKIRAMVAVPLDEESPLKLIHLSFRDFVLSKKRSKRIKFHVEENEMHENVLIRCLDIMSSELRQDICSLIWPGTLDSEIPRDILETKIQQYLRYSCRYWVDHLSSLGPRLQENSWLVKGGRIYVFLQQHFLYWLEVMSLIKEGPAAVLIMNMLHTLAQESGSLELSSLAYDMKRFVLNSRWIIDHTPLQIYVSAVIFSPIGIKIRPLLDSYMPPWIEQQPAVENHWTNEICALEGHTDSISAVSFSPTDNLLLSSSSDGITKLWDYLTGTQRFSFEDHMIISCATFSSDGKFIALGSSEGYIVVRELSSGSKIRLQGHELVELTMFSPQDNTILASASSDQEFRIWDIHDSCTQHMFRITDYCMKEIHFTEDGESLIIPGYDSITIWNVNTGQCTQRFNSASQSAVNDVSVPMEIQNMVICAQPSGEIDGENDSDGDSYISCVSVVSRSTGNTMIQYFYDGHVELISRFPPGGNSVLVKTKSGSIDLLGTESWSKARQFDTNLNDIICALSSDGRLMVSGGFEDHSIRLWDMRLNAIGDESSQRSTASVLEVGFSPDLSLIYTRFDGDPRFEVYDSTGIRFSLPTDGVYWIDFSKDGRYVVLHTQSCSQLWNKGMTELLLTSENIQLSSNGVYIAIALDNGGVQLLNTSTWNEIMIWYNIVEVTLGFHEDIAYIQYINWESRVQFLELWNLSSKERLFCKVLQNNTILIDPKFSPDSSVFAYGSRYDNTYSETLWKVLYLTTGKEYCAVACNELVFHPEGHLFSLEFFQPHCIEIRETRSSKLVHKFKPPINLKSWIHHKSMTFSTSGKFASSMETELGWTVRFWDIASGSEIGKYTMAGMITDLSMMDDTYFVCRQGRLPIPSPVPSEGQIDAKNHVPGLLYVGSQWVYHGLQRIMWLPPALRSDESILRGNTLVIPQEVGGIKVIKFNTDKLPAR